MFTRNDGLGTINLLSDGLNSTLALTDPSGLIHTRYAYAPFGQTTAAGSSSNNTFQFTRRENDGTGLYYYRARYYNPTFGRFISEDPLEFGGGDINLYAYVGNSPLNATDPSGASAAAIALPSAVFGAPGAVAAGASAAVAAAAVLAALSALVVVVAIAYTASAGSGGPPKCDEAAIRERRNELVSRYDAMIRNPLNLPRTGPMSQSTHVDQFLQKQTNLRRMLNDWTINNCQGDIGDAWTWATMEPPEL